MKALKHYDMTNDINNRCVAQWITRCPPGETVFFFFIVVLFCFVSFFLTYRKRFAASLYQEIMSPLTVNLKKLERTS